MLTDGAMQELWKHRVPKDHYTQRCRINFTFRVVNPTQTNEVSSGDKMEKVR